MKKFKNFVVLVMALAMFLSAGLGSVQLKAAENEGSITVTGTTKDKSYSVYRIFDLTYTGDNENKKVSYTISDEWKSFFSKEPGTKYIVATDEGENLNPIIVDGTVKYINITDQNIADFAKDAMGNMGNVEKVATQKASGDSVTFSGLKLGYYLVHPEGATDKKDNQNSIVSLTSTTPKAEVKVKATYPTVEKKVDKPTADIGQELTYTLTSKVPDTTGYSEYTFKMTDALSEGLTFVSTKDNVEVKIAGDTITDNVTKEIDGQKLTVTFNMLKLQDKVGETITVTYKAKLNKDAVITNKDNPNEVTLEYSNDPKDSEKTDTTKDEEKVYTAKVIVKKVDGKDQKALKDAKFVLKKSKGKFYKVDENTKEVTWVDKQYEATEVTTDNQGAASFEGLAEGIYYLVETKAPEGYNLLTEEKEVEIKATKGDDGAVTAIVDGEAKVANNSGVQLPGTGGIGTTIFSVIGGLIILFAVLSLSKSKVKKARN